jgi:hypothetical protein
MRSTSSEMISLRSKASGAEMEESSGMMSGRESSMNDQLIDRLKSQESDDSSR